MKYQEANIIMIDANERQSFNNRAINYPSDYCLWGNKLYHKNGVDYPFNLATFQHFYVISDEKIKQGDWYIDDCNQIRQSVTSNREYWAVRTNYKKIIATTNKDLGLPQLQQEFILQYVNDYNKGNTINKIEVEYEEVIISKTEWFQEAPYVCKYDVIIIKVNPDNTINIKPIKSNFSREEVIDLINKFSYENCDDAYQKNDKWIKENL